MALIVAVLWPRDKLKKRVPAFVRMTEFFAAA
jgi:hypothetical protein